MFIDQRMIDYAQLLCTATRADPRIRLGLGPDHAQKIIDQAKQLATDANRSWLTPNDIKTVFKTYPRGKMFAVDEGSVDPVIADVLNNTAVP
jgi:hypothetical protein